MLLDVLHPPHVERAAFELEAVMPFERSSDGRRLTAFPQRSFLPRGLMIWDAGEANVQAEVARDRLEVAYGAVPARWFAVSQSFEQVVKALVEGREPGRGWGTWPIVTPGNVVRLDFDRPVLSAVAIMWGHTCKL